MTNSAEISLRHNRQARATAVVAAAMLLLFGLGAAAQDAKPSPPAPTYQPGMLDSVGRWFKGSFSGFGSRTVDAAKEAADAAKDAADAAKEAAMKFPNARLVEGRERCAVAANGAADCRKAIEAVCKAKGFSSGSSLEIQASQKCRARAWISGGPTEPGDCEMQSFVTRAMCQ
jgi:hypothetical protein